MFQRTRKEHPLLTYYKPIKTAEGFTLSIDKAVIDYKLNGPPALDELVKFLDMLPIRMAVEVKNWSSFRWATFRENFTIGFQDHNSFWLGVGLNNTKTEHTRARLEWNPNKCARHSAFLAVLAFLNEHTRPLQTSIKRFDFAVDIPVKRENAKLVKDGRVYSERRHGKEWTEYLGPKSSTVGRCKLYNKQVEAELLYPLTRLEITLDPTTPFDALPWPNAYYIKRWQIGVEELSINDTERYILSALLAGYGSTRDLCRKTREKMEKLMAHYVQNITITPHDYAEILFTLSSFLRYPRYDLGVDNIDPDQPPRPHPLLPDWVQEVDKASGGELADTFKYNLGGKPHEHNK